MGEVILLGNRLRVVRDARALRRLAKAERERQRKVREAANCARQRAYRAQRAVLWADAKAIAMVYAEAERMTRETGVLHEVDHVIPLKGKLVSGLHVETNLRVITKRANRRKYNHFETA